ncbi:MAG: cupin domain-containing protein [Anaerolineales bacterium]|nr:cupin domain-containing protein [Anaerolineales bacterium]
MYKIYQSADLPHTPGGTLRFEGALYGSDASFFHVNVEPGKGSTLHKHPYPETWIVRAGNVRFTVGGEQIEATSGAIVIGAKAVPHKFVNLGPGRLEMICIHPSPQILQEAVTEDFT